MLRKLGHKVGAVQMYSRQLQTLILADEVLANVGATILERYSALIQTSRLRWKTETSQIQGTRAAAHVAPLTAYLLGQNPASETTIVGGVILLCFDHFARAVDAQTDKNLTSPVMTHEGGLTLLLGQRLLLSSGLNPLSIWTELSARFEEASLAERTLATRQKNLDVLFTDELMLLGKKNAIMAIAPALIGGNQSHVDYSQATTTLELLFQVIQLLDDLVDWQEDLQNAQYTYLLRRAANKACTNVPAMVPDGLFRCGVALELIEEMREIAARAFAPYNATEIVQIANHIDRNLQACSVVLKQAKNWTDFEKLQRRLSDIIIPEVAYN